MLYDKLCTAPEYGHNRDKNFTILKIIFQCIKELLTTYADGILALDACGWNDAALMEIIDPQVYHKLVDVQCIAYRRLIQK